MRSIQGHCWPVSGQAKELGVVGVEVVGAVENDHLYQMTQLLWVGVAGGTGSPLYPHLGSWMKEEVGVVGTLPY